MYKLDKQNDSNDLQNLFSSITGYERNLPFTSAQDDYYYNLETKEEKIQQLKDYAANALDLKITDADINRVYAAIECINQPQDAIEIYENLGE